jgi:hypothetical protein
LHQAKPDYFTANLPFGRGEELERCFLTVSIYDIYDKIKLSVSRSVGALRKGITFILEVKGFASKRARERHAAAK